MDIPSEENKIDIGPEALKNLNSTRKWTMFLAVLGFIFLGIMIITLAATGTFLAAFKTREADLGLPESLIMTLFGVVAIIFYLPVLFLFRFSRNTRDAVQNRDKEKLDKAFRNLRIYFTYFGILVIIILSLYLLALILAGSSMAFLRGI
jgi:uncharacterized membrane protein